MSRLKVEPSEATLGAIVTGVRLCEVTEADWSAIEAAFHERAVLVFLGQHLTPPQQVEFGRRFGKIEHLFGDRGYVPISNQRRDDSLLADDELPMQVMHGNGLPGPREQLRLALKTWVAQAELETLALSSHIGSRRPYSPRASGAPSAANMGTAKAAAEIITALGGTRWLKGSATSNIASRGG